MITKDLEDPVNTRNTRTRQSLVPNIEGASSADPSAAEAFVPDGLEEVSLLINAVVSDGAARNYQNEGAIPRPQPEVRVVTLPRANEHQTQTDNDQQEFDPLASCPDLAALNVGPYLRSHATRELQEFFPGNKENISENQIFDWIVSTIFRPMKQLVTQENLDLIDQEKKEIHETQVRLHSIRVDSTQTLEQARRAQELSSISKAPKTLIDWIQTNIEPFRSGEPIPMDAVLLSSIVKDSVSKTLGIQINTLNPEILEQLGSEKNIRFMNKKHQENGGTDLRRINDDAVGQGNRVGSLGRLPPSSSVLTEPRRGPGLTVRGSNPPPPVSYTHLTLPTILLV